MSNRLISEWMVPEEAPHCAMRILLGTDPSDIANRVAFIEKTPRVRVLPFAADAERDDCWNWFAGPKGDDAYGADPESRAWCDMVLQHIGYALPTP